MEDGHTISCRNLVLAFCCRFQSNSILLKVDKEVLYISEYIISKKRRFDSRITKFATEKFERDEIDVKTGSMVIKVSDKHISTKEKKTGQTVSIPYGMVLWSTGIATRPVIMDFMKQIGQGNRRVLATDEWLRVEGCDGVYALGDCATINQRKVMEDIAVIFSKADKNNSGTLDLKDFKDVVDHISERYPQVQIYMEKKKLKTFDALLKSAQGNDNKLIDIETFKNALHEVDSQMKNLPATAQVAAQQGEYLASCFNRMEQCEKYPEGPMRFRGTGCHRFRPFRYKIDSFRENADTSVDYPMQGISILDNLLHWEESKLQLNFREIGFPNTCSNVNIMPSSDFIFFTYSKLVSWRTRVLVVSDWLRRSIFGRDSSRI
ncbi:hypothetical protein POTOM_045861 [Populus tomentosa]|uniref:EF-hand domain-containing protein n=1 Tax=Populus tomentosa TaxID=118781 RepID=A0A8X7YDY2_POPTO|nr:hypothetical protein POTOM_045861 [Populus tomentosa]